MPRDWDATTYERLSAPLEAMGREVLWRLELDGDETVLDAGCGTGRVTAVLAQRLPAGRVIAVDGSPSMVEQARAKLPGNVDTQVQDLLELSVDEPVDAIVSTATFHWVLDHDTLFTRIRDALKPGGRLVAQCGGEGNVAAVKAAGLEIAQEEPFASHLKAKPADWKFASPKETEARLLRLGFEDVWCWATRVDVPLDDPEGYLGAICLGSFLEELPAELHDDFVAAAIERLGTPITLEYVRLNILARAPRT